MDKIPFTVYDFFAYLSSGAVLVATADYIWGLGLLANKEVSPILGVALIILAYVTGHIIAHFSSWLLEQTIVHRVLKSPSVLLLGGEPRWNLFALVFRNYHRPLSKSTQQQVREQAAARNCKAKGEDLFQHAYPIVTSNERFQVRLDDFRNQYGFARNISFALFTSAVAVCVAYGLGHAVRLRWAILSAVGGVGMFYRFLKFFRQYSYELLLRYSELPNSEVSRNTFAGAQ